MAGEVAPQLDIHWNLAAEDAEVLGPELEAVEAAVRRAVQAEGLSGPADLGVTLTGDEGIRELNASYRGLDEITDVLSFSMSEGDDGFVAPPDGVNHLGDVVISLYQARRQAPELGRTVQQELALLAVHGVLHLLGYDHAEEEETREMQARERAALDG